MLAAGYHQPKADDGSHPHSDQQIQFAAQRALAGGELGRRPGAAQGQVDAVDAQIPSVAVDFAHIGEGIEDHA
jgi:hypothetical protein